jgi:hypothetical protein
MTSSYLPVRPRFISEATPRISVKLSLRVSTIKLVEKNLYYTYEAVIIQTLHFTIRNVGTCYRVYISLRSTTFLERRFSVVNI